MRSLSFLARLLAAAAANDLTRGLAALGSAAENCATRAGAAGLDFARCVQDAASYPNFLLPRPLFDEALRNASCRLPGASRALRRHTLDISAGGSDCSEQARRLDVEVFREHPPVALIKGFAPNATCARLLLVAGGLDSLSPAVARGVAGGFYRRSSSKNVANHELDAHPALQSLRAEMFLAAKQLTGYSLNSTSPEPLNIAAYRNPGDEYRPHCDGRCSGDRHRPGERVATSILYCQVPTEGGHTTFTHDALKIAPSEGDLLVFGYLIGQTMARGEAEHSACPVLAGGKWIATQWYAEENG
ncbi:dpy-18 [Symbiodinium natans]|uniref:Dpy-18 protein n=1 Tax=Symbiodinium natans TaxID=878477 RepID=A0A812L3L0_9DINO|nr:dpy-18 [Symbiodinium natans]